MKLLMMVKGSGREEVEGKIEVGQQEEKERVGKQVLARSWEKRKKRTGWRHLGLLGHSQGRITLLLCFNAETPEC